MLANTSAESTTDMNIFRERVDSSYKKNLEVLNELMIKDQRRETEAPIEIRFRYVLPSGKACEQNVRLEFDDFIELKQRMHQFEVDQ